LKDAKTHKEYDEINAKLDQVPLGSAPDYDRACYLRHFAMAALGGGWLSDYDIVPFNIDPEAYGKNLPNGGKFTTFENGTPSLIVGNAEEWDRVSKAMVREGISAKDDESRGVKKQGQPRLFSDMFALESLMDKKEIIVSDPSHPIQAAFQLHEEWISKAKEILTWNLEPNPSLKEHCETMKIVMALHISHFSITEMHFLYSRPLLMAEYLDRWSKLCDGPAFALDDLSEDDSTNVAALSLYDTDATMGISRENSLIYVNVPQTGGTLFEYSGLFNDAIKHHPIGGHRTIGEMTHHAKEREVSDFIKTAHIRHPCDRFISAFELMTSDQANAGDKRWTQQYIGEKSIDEFVLGIEKNPEELLLEAHFSPMWQWLFQPSGRYGLDITMCHETWGESLDRLSNGFNIPVPAELKTNAEMTNQQSKCQGLRPETVAAIERIYHMDYCIFGYDSLPQKSCPQQDLSAEEITQKYYACAAAVPRSEASVAAK
jgi:hypothetical protein